ncbi:MAG: aminoacetone oxidase family FAD-binding enzyme [Clostridia bacterium]|nr:aminoacetone oxidase family FAD-binding enzyme [Clostridia bacterium]
MERIKIAIIGGGASGLFLATALQQNKKVVLFERGDRVGRKLSATGNGQGNITNLAALETEYFSVKGESPLTQAVLNGAGVKDLYAYFQSLGVLLSADERGRVYPASRQASALTDALRFCVAQKGVDVRLSTRVYDMEKTDGGFIVYAEEGAEGHKISFFAEKVILAVGGKAAKNFGSDGNGYALAQKFGHTVTALYPSLVQLKTDVTHTKTLKGIRINDGGLTAILSNGMRYKLRGDVIFTDYGVSGDAVFRMSAFIADQISAGVRLAVDFLPDVTEEEIFATLQRKRAAFPELPETELLFGIVNNQVGRAVLKRAKGNLREAAKLVKSFDLTVTGSLGFDYAQVTKGGIPLAEVTENLESRFAQGLYFTGEILDVDGQCGGFNLQWAYSSAMRVAHALEEV